MRSGYTCASAEGGAPAKVTIVKTERVSSLRICPVRSLRLVQTFDDLRGACVVPFAHFVHEGDGVLEQADLLFQRLEQPASGGHAGRLRLHRGAVLRDR